MSRSSGKESELCASSSSNDAILLSLERKLMAGHEVFDSCRYRVGLPIAAGKEAAHSARCARHSWPPKPQPWELL